MKRILYVLLSLLILPLALTGWQVKAADDLPDLSKKGSITIQFNKNYPLQGSEYAIWHVADIKSVDGPYKYVNTDDFKDVHMKWTNEDLDYWDQVDSAPVIGFVDDYVQEKNIKPYATATIGASNKVTFSDLPLGIYLVKQTKTGPDGYVMTTYLATIPDEDGNYDVTSNAKTDPYGPASTPDPKPKDPYTPTQKPNTNNNVTNNYTNNITTKVDRTEAKKPNTAIQMMQDNLILICGLALVFIPVLYWMQKTSE